MLWDGVGSAVMVVNALGMVRPPFHGVPGRGFVMDPWRWYGPGRGRCMIARSRAMVFVAVAGGEEEQGKKPADDLFVIHDK